MTNASHPSGGRLKALDVLRGIAVLLVLGRHLPIPVEEFRSFWLAPLQVWKRVGWTGVDLFFVLSGFLVSGLLFREYQRSGGIRLGRFFVRRGIRIYVPFYAFLVPSLLLRLPYLSPRRLGIELLFLQSYFSHKALWNHTWSLAIEEHFYLFLGLVFLACLRKRRSDPFKPLVPFFFLLAAACLWLRTGRPLDDPLTFTASHLRFDSLFFGVLLSYFFHLHSAAFHHTVQRFKPAILCLSIATFLPVFFFEPYTGSWMARGGLTLLYLSFGGWLALSVAQEPSENLKNPGFFAKGLVFVGGISYSVYLWHVMVREIWLRTDPAFYTPLTIWVVCLAYIALCLAAGWAAHRLIEKPSLAWRDRRFPSA